MSRTKLKDAVALALAATLSIFSSLAAARRPQNHHSALELLVVGSGGPRSFGRASTSYVVLVDGTARILVDAGPGAFLEMGKLGIQLNRLDIVLLTHLHIDHSGDIPAVFLDRALTADGPIRFKVFGPAGANLFPSTSSFLKLLFEPGGIYEYEKTFGAEQTIETKDLPISLKSPQNEILSDGELSVSEISTHHGDCPSIAYRVDYADKSIVFSGDMDASALGNIEHLAANADLLVFHVGALDPPHSPDVLYTLHTPPKQIGQAAKAAGARHLLLSHISPAIEQNRRQVLRSIRIFYSKRVDFAYDGMRVPVVTENK